MRETLGALTASGNLHEGKAPRSYEFARARSHGLTTQEMTDCTWGSDMCLNGLWIMKQGGFAR